MSRLRRERDPGKSASIMPVRTASVHTPCFRNRKTAALELVDRLEEWKGLPGVLVLALARGGVPVGYEIATRLGAQLDVLLVEKIRYDDRIIEAIEAGGTFLRDLEVQRETGFSDEELDRIEATVLEALRRREHDYRGDRPRPSIENRHVIVTDDGLVTGWSMRTALAEIWKRKPIDVVAALPVVCSDNVPALHLQADEVICVAEPKPFVSHADCYDDFSPVSDVLVRAFLHGAWGRESAIMEGAEPPAGAFSRHGWET